MNLGITCFPTFGGSGLIASEIGLAMAARGHQVHFIARALPVRLQRATNVSFHEVAQSQYPSLVDSSAYPIALASKMIEVATAQRLDLLHVHYAVPHATAAWMAAEVMGSKAPRIVTTLHGTDITLVGSDPSHLPITRYSVQRSDAVTTPSEFLRRATWQKLELPDSLPIEVIPNFVDTTRFVPTGDKSPLRALFNDDAPTLVHVSNFRPVKRIADVVSIFAAVNLKRPAHMVLVGDGPERAAAEAQVKALGLEDRVAFLGERDDFEAVLAACDVFLLPSELESFGLAALEAQSAGVPVVGTLVGGVSEVVKHGETGFLVPVGDIAAMAAAVQRLLNDKALFLKMSQKARARVVAHFDQAKQVDAYVAYFSSLLSNRAQRL